MKNHITDQIADYLANDLDRMQRAEVESHLDTCAVCREEFDSLLRLWAKLGALPAEKPSPELRTRFTTMLEAYQEGSRNAAEVLPGFLRTLEELVGRFWPQHRFAQVGVTLALVIVAVILGIQLGKPSQNESELAQLRGEVQTMGRLLTVSLLNQQSASERLRGVSWTTQIDVPDPQITNALIEALKYDANVNVRLAAVDALGKFVSEPRVQKEIVDAIPAQSSPLVQIALVDLVVREGVKKSEAILRSVAADPHTNPAVRKRIEESIDQLSL